MLSRKYVHDYRMVEDLDKRGRLCRRAEYIGGAYYPTAGEAALVSAAGRCRLLLLLGAAAYIAALLPCSLAADTVYILLPFVFSLLPLALALARVRILRQAAPWKHEEADRLASLPACALFLLLLSIGPLLALGITALRRPGALLPGDAVFALGCGVLSAVGAVLLRLKPLFRCEKQDGSVY